MTMLEDWLVQNNKIGSGSFKIIKTLTGFSLFVTGFLQSVKGETSQPMAAFIGVAHQIRKGIREMFVCQTV